MKRWKAGVALASVALLCMSHLGARAQDAMHEFSLCVTVAANESGQPVVPDAWIEERIDAANALFAPARIHFSLNEIRSMDASHALLEDRAARHSLAPFAQSEVVNVFVVQALRDVDAEGFRMGVHWRGTRPRGVHYVIISATAARTTLAHELGHFFGNPHSPTPNNIMSYDRNGAVPPFFDEAQLIRIRAHARRYLQTRELIERRANSPEPSRPASDR